MNTKLVIAIGIAIIIGIIIISYSQMSDDNIQSDIIESEIQVSEPRTFSRDLIESIGVVTP